ncbi:glycosyltransferase family 39 protein, partial [Vibrio parahaemolyticus]
ISPFLELGNDEVYYWTYAIRPDWNYFDHPPMVGLLIRFTTFNLNWVSEFSICLGSVVCAALSTWFIFKTGKLLSSERVGWYAALLYTASIYTT